MAGVGAGGGRGGEVCEEEQLTGPFRLHQSGTDRFVLWPRKGATCAVEFCMKAPSSFVLSHDAGDLVAEGRCDEHHAARYPTLVRCGGCGVWTIGQLCLSCARAESRMEND